MLPKAVLFLRTQYVVITASAIKCLLSNYYVSGTVVAGNTEVTRVLLH